MALLINLLWSTSSSFSPGYAPTRSWPHTSPFSQFWRYPLCCLQAPIPAPSSIWFLCLSFLCRLPLNPWAQYSRSTRPQFHWPILVASKYIVWCLPNHKMSSTLLLRNNRSKKLCRRSTQSSDQQEGVARKQHRRWGRAPWSVLREQSFWN